MLLVGGKNDTITILILYLHELYLITREGKLKLLTTNIQLFYHIKKIFLKYMKTGNTVLGFPITLDKNSVTIIEGNVIKKYTFTTISSANEFFTQKRITGGKYLHKKQIFRSKL